MLRRQDVAVVIERWGNGAVVACPVLSSSRSWPCLAFPDGLQGDHEGLHGYKERGEMES